MKRESLYHLLKQSMIILCLLSSAAAEGVECRYLSKLTKENPQPELSAQGTCGEFAGQDEFRMYPEYLNKVFFKNGLAEILVDDKAFYIAESGKGVRVYLFDNGDGSQTVRQVFDKKLPVSGPAYFGYRSIRKENNKGITQMHLNI